ncbi:PREDICTED: uncharacterized protein LOC109159879 [Ipomoea nil]|uniref:uncharacterized protein LOC109159879 n=1 Tax=Ipomoea nil TaxID=35883 RepID=UPI000900A74E|nr:PREDICTED: uncharacterized protein LOC109159879 [Ipomoea nil]
MLIVVLLLGPPPRLPRQNAVWSTPLVSFLKLNIDIALDHENCRMGFGWIVRDDARIVMSVVMFSIPGLFSVKEVEAIGAREALSWIKDKGCQRVILESYAQWATNAIEKDVNKSPFGTVIHEIKLFLQHLPYVKFVFVQRSGNRHAHVLTRQALCTSEEESVECFDFIPSFLSDSVCKDILVD